MTTPTRPFSDFTVTQPSEPAGASRSVVAACVIGNALEFYDFITYAFFAVYIGRAFFPADSAALSLLLSVAVFGVGFIARPLGGVVIGRFADRVGRRPAMLLTIGLITVGTLGLAATPSYDSIGMAAPLIVVSARLLQGFALGGEVGPASAFLVEVAPHHRRGLYASWQMASQGAAGTVAGLIGLWVSSTLSPADMQAWGWRVPFAVGLLLVPTALYLRRRMPETLRDPVGQSQNGDPEARRSVARFVALAILVGIGGTVSSYVSAYMTTYAITSLGIEPRIAMGATVVGGACTVVFSLLGGWLSDRHGRRVTMIWPRALAAVVAVPLFGYLVAQPSAVNLLVVAGVLASLTSLSGAAMMVAIPESLPAWARATGMSITYAVATAVFGGTTQLVVTWLIGVTDVLLAPAWYVMGTSLVSVVAMYFMPERRNQRIDSELGEGMSRHGV